MRNKLSKIALVASLLLALAFAISCTSGNDDENANLPLSSSSGGGNANLPLSSSSGGGNANPSLSSSSSGGIISGTGVCLISFGDVKACSQEPVNRESCEEDGWTFRDSCPTTNLTLTCDIDGETVFFYGDMKGGDCDNPFRGLPANSCTIDYETAGKMCMQHAILSQSICNDLGMGFSTSFSSGNCPVGGLECAGAGEMGAKTFLYGNLIDMGCPDIN